MNKITTNIIATGLLSLMFGLAFFSVLGDANTMDELAHTGAGYSYIVKQDMRLNPEHPPLLKDLAGLSVWLSSKITKTQINFPDQIEAWQKEKNGQWDFGRQFLFHNGNDADKIILWARLPMILIMILLGFYVFKWARERYGNKAGLIALFLYSLSPTLLAHGRLVTTDVGAAACFFIATYYLIKWLQDSTKKNLIIAGIIFGLALLTKFSLALLIPYFGVITILWMIINRKWKPLFGLILIGIIAMILVYPVYLFNIWNLPMEKQVSDANYYLGTYGNRLLADPTLWMNTNTILRPYGQFFTGLLMVIQRASGGNTAYFMGEISNVAWPLYFPIVFLIKVPLALFVLILISLFSMSFPRKRESSSGFPIKLGMTEKIRITIKKYFTEIALLIFLAIYWYTSVTSNLNIGVRHVLPIFPILYILISGQISKWLCLPPGPFLEKVKLTPKKLFVSVKMTTKAYFILCFKYLILAILLFWYAFGVIQIYPHFITYFNESIGGPTQGYKYVTDSNLDWGQDLKRLAQFVEDNKIQTIYVDYFGGDDLKYRLDDKFQFWWGKRDPSELPANSWIAISASFIQSGRGITTKGFIEKADYYNWLDQYEPITIIGNSIFVYYIK
ncbi:glycosyltransferase family 39 protein [Patescibacteria group bacterium]|nr:glycosyltransferase family 39 protein [Patescibacteria group bacterium]